MMRPRVRSAIVFGALVLLLAFDAWGQRSGGSVSSGSRSSSSSPSSSRSSSSSGGRRGSLPTWAIAFMCGTIGTVLGGFALLLYVTGRRPADFERLTVVIGPGGRRHAQARLTHLAQRADAPFPMPPMSGGLPLTETAARLVGIVELLGELEPSWTHAHCRRERMRFSQASSTLDQEAQKLRARFEHEVVRRDGDSLHESTLPPDERDARDADEPGLIVVSVMVVTDTQRRLSAPSLTIEDVRSALRELHDVATGGPMRLQRFEVVWSPAEDRDRMSERELQRLYPEVERIAHAALR